MPKSISSTLYLTLLLAAHSFLIPLAARAQVTADGTTSTTVNQNGTDFTIEQGSRVGNNLFHSFDEFSVPTLGSALFNNAGDITNIFSRVTGSNISNIDGLIGANGEANLYLINPNGIIFGENSRLNLGGSFFASTADSLLFGGNTEFSASNPSAAPLLAVNIPIGLSFRDNPGNIVNRSSVQNIDGDSVGLEVAPGKNITLVGGDINIEAGRATASGGNIELGGLSAAGTVGINDDGSLSFPENVAKADVTLSNAADLDVRGTGGGNITINARNLSLEAGESGGSLIRAGITVNSTSSEAQAGDVVINTTDNLTVDESRILNQVDTGAEGDAGGITITTGSLSLTKGGIVSASTFGQGNAGSVNITASDTLTFDGEDSDGFPSGVTSAVGSEAVGDAGGINITTGSLSLTNGGRVSASTLGQGNAGSVNITATDTITFDGEALEGFPSGVTSQVNSGAEGNAGGVTINTGSLILTKGGRVDSSTFGRGNAGLVNITASDTLTFDGESLRGFPSGAISRVDSEAVGDTRGVTITTSSLSLTNGGIIDASTFGQGNAGSVNITATDTITFDGEDSDDFPSGVTSEVGLRAVGDGGGINITTGSLLLTNRGRVSTSTRGQGNAGSVNITATNTITFDSENSFGLSRSGVTSEVGLRAVGDGGGINITTGSLFLTNGGSVATNTFGQGNAGSVNITATDTITFDGEDSGGLSSGVTSQVSSIPVQFGSIPVGDGGGITITTGSLFLTNGGSVATNTFGQGNAGSVNITATDTITFDGEDSFGFSTSGVSSQVGPIAVGDGGGITITTGSLFLTNGGSVATDTSGQGNAGSVNITATDTITFDGENSFGRLPSGVSSQVGSGAEGNAGGITINTGSLSLTNGGRVDAKTIGQGHAASVEINVSESITINGVTENNRSGIFANALVSKGDGGDVNITTNQFNINNGGTIEVGNFDSLELFAPGTGQPGDINIEANSLSLSNEARIDAVTQAETGDNANITLQISEDLILRDSSFISAQALEDANGGNLTIDTEFVIAFPNQNNDLIANANRGNGGRIEITAQSLFGIEERLSTPPNQTNDIDASTQFGLQQGSVVFNTPNLDPTSGLIELPETVGDPSDQVSQNPCEQGVGSEFIVTGKGGLPSNPNETLNGNRVRVGLVDPIISGQEKEVREISSVENSKAEAVPAQGWIFNDKGEVMLTSYKTTSTEIRQSRQQNPLTCSIGIEN
ncbi:MAG: S-layer family protein [Cyanobacteria bacterium P01_F01_bin.143]